ncbi:hypothetical protein B0H16DRAFT_1023502 [Mycena metata]|uniref:NAD(P)-binding protein n=1 Tax=Mycena metata TaxID=1033252 RepID=A0AAD7II85_9AGAR|nr:hypothetical protein B0H16DRAFT_1023502 [Mycena metata]
MSSNKVILVTGSNTGIGYDLVHLLAAKGHTVYLSSRNAAAGAEAVYDFIWESITPKVTLPFRAKIKKEKSLHVKFVQLDVTDSASVTAAAAKIEQDEGCLNVLVNNAGISEMHKLTKVSEVDLTSLRATFETNLVGLIQTTTAFLPLLRASHTPEVPSVILNVTTGMASNALMASPEGILHQAVPYNTSKVAVNSYTIALAHELKDEGIKVNCVSPGFTTTKLNGFAPGGKTPEQGAAVLVEWALLDDTGKTGHFASDSGEMRW